MRFNILAFVWFAALAAAPITLTADAACCDAASTNAKACCDKPATACCDKPAADAAAPAAGCCQKADTHAHGAAPAAAADGAGCAMPCCADGAKCDMPCCADGKCDMPCCNEQVAGATEPSAIDILFALDSQAILPGSVKTTGTTQTAVVFFQRPVWVGSTVLMGKYVIEHDTDRQARGEPCTHIYAVGNQGTPVATFHCTHLDADVAGSDTVLLKSNTDGTQKLLQFQFKGETAAHGYPADH